jgi:uncharacterized protein YabN with tetrapyrrole methylase and pyrophosphatase domain
MPPRKPKPRTARAKNRKFTPPRVGPDFQKLVAVMSRLRSPNGCPWDREQTHSTLRTYLIEEAYEALDALDSTDDAKFAEELGDLLLQVLFHAQIAHEEGRFDISAVIREIHNKMVRRHPHVFGATKANTAAEVLRNWEQIKQQERAAAQANPVAKRLPVAQRFSPEAFPSRSTAPTQGNPVAQGESASPEAVSSATSGSQTSQASHNAPAPNSDPAPEARHLPDEPSILDGVPRAIPALLEALQLTRKAARIGFDWPNLDGIFSKLTEETNELHDVLASKPTNPSRIEGELGDILFVAVNLARFLDIDPEIALKKTSAKFSRRFRTMERLAREQNTTLPKLPRPQMESLWDQAKQLESK